MFEVFHIPETIVESNEGAEGVGEGEGEGVWDNTDPNSLNKVVSSIISVYIYSVLVVLCCILPIGPVDR